MADPQVLDEHQQARFVHLMFSYLKLFKNIYLGTMALVYSSAVLLAANVVSLKLAVKLFQRETILTRWK